MIWNTELHMLKCNKAYSEEFVACGVFHVLGDDEHRSRRHHRSFESQNVRMGKSTHQIFVVQKVNLLIGRESLFQPLDQDIYRRVAVKGAELSPVHIIGASY